MPEFESRARPHLLAIVLIASVAGLLFGFETAVVAGTTRALIVLQFVVVLQFYPETPGVSLEAIQGRLQLHARGG